MGMVVRTNTMSTNAYRQLGMNNTQLAKSLEKLSSGFRINRAGDDASGLAISEKMKAQIKGLEQASSNSQDGISLVQTAEGALTEVHSMLNRMAELATKSANGTIQNDVDRDAIQTEVDALNTEISRIAKSTNFNGIQLLDGSLGGARTGALSSASTSVAASTIGTTAATKASFTTGAITQNAAGETMSLTVNYTDAAGEAKTATVSGITYSNTATDANIARAIETKIASDSTLGSLFESTGSTGDVVSLQSKTAGLGKGAITGIAVATGTLTFGANSAVAGEDSSTSITLGAAMAAGDTITLSGKTYEMVGNAADEPKTSGATTFVDAAALITAAKKDGITLTGTIGNGDTLTASYDGTGSAGLTIQVGTTNDSYNQVTVSIDNLSAEGLGIENLDVSTRENAGNAIATINAAINKVSTNRGNLGALQNRLEYATNSLDTTAENMDAANSRIRDTDMAKEMMTYTKMNILSQAAQAMLAQANQQPQNILQLLQ